MSEHGKTRAGVSSFAARFRQQGSGYPMWEYGHTLIHSPDGSVRDPSEILLIDGRYTVYFTFVPRPLTDGFFGSIYCSSCAATDPPANPDSWTKPHEVIPQGDPAHDHDGTGCFTPDCTYDGRHVYVFYTGLNSTHPKGFPCWGDPREPEHILVAKSTRPDGGFVKSIKRTPLTTDSRRLGFDEATVPGGHEMSGGEPLYCTSLIDHGQCWVMPDGERRYYFKGGGLGKGAVCLMRDLDENWLNGRWHGPRPILRDPEGRHMEGILITRVDDRLFLQLQGFGHDNRPGPWVTWISDARDGIRWEYVGGAHRPKPDCMNPMSIGVYSPDNPLWGIGQFPGEDGLMELAYMNVR